MQRDVGNEVIVAIVAVGVLAFVIMFAVILSLSSTDNPVPATQQAGAVTSTPAVSTPAVIVTLTPTPSPTEPPTNAPPTVGAETRVTEDVETSVAIVTTVAPTTATDTATPAATRVTEAAETEVAVLATTAAPTNTVAPTNTTTPTDTATRQPPTATATASKTNTAIPTATNTLTATPTLTRTPRPTETSGIRPTPTGTRTAVPTAASAACTPQAGWYTYTVRAGETLSIIARAVNSSVGVLQRANCLQDPNQIYTGQILSVPQLPPANQQPNPPPAGGLSVEGCSALTTQITNLTPGQRVNGILVIRGTAAAQNFQYYKIEVRPDFASVFNFYSRSEQPIEQGVLGTIDPTIFGSGLHWIKLTVISDVHQQPCVIPVIFP